MGCLVASDQTCRYERSKGFREYDIIPIRWNSKALRPFRVFNGKSWHPLGPGGRLSMASSSLEESSYSGSLEYFLECCDSHNLPLP